MFTEEPSDSIAYDLLNDLGSQGDSLLSLDYVKQMQNE